MLCLGGIATQPGAPGIYMNLQYDSLVVNYGNTQKEKIGAV